MDDKSTLEANTVINQPGSKQANTLRGTEEGVEGTETLGILT